MKTSRMAVVLGLMLTATGGSVIAGEILIDSCFNASPDSAGLRANSPGQDWYESRQDHDYPGLLTLDCTTIGGNATCKAQFSASNKGNAYLTQEFSSPQTQALSAQWDIYVNSILDLPDDPDRAGWMLIGDDTGTDPNRIGPNAEDSERFVYMAFYKNGGGTAGTMDLVARQRNDTWQEFTTVAAGLKLKQWYTIKVSLDLVKDTYDVYVDGQYKATLTSRTAKSSVTHISFAQWNDGAGTFSVDNVTASTAFNSYPADGALDTAQQRLTLTWPAGQDTVLYYLYFGNSLEAVAAGDPVTLRGAFVETSIDPGVLEWDQNYYWRVDRKQADGTIIAGEVWGFRTADFLPVDDFESYLIPGEDITRTWIPAGSVTGLFAEHSLVYSGTGSLALAYDNVPKQPFAEARRTFDAPQDWTVNGGDTLSLRVRGEASNAPQTLYVELGDLVDGEKSWSRVEHPDPNIVRITEWTEWSIPLRAFSGIDVNAIGAMTIGVGNRALMLLLPIENSLEIQTFATNSAGDPSGTIYIDCTRVISLSGEYPEVGFWGHVWEKGTYPEVAVSGAKVVFKISDPNKEYPNEHPTPGPGEYYISVPDNQTYTVTVSAGQFKEGTFTLYISATDTAGNVHITMDNCENGECGEGKLFDANVAGCGANGLDFYLVRNN